MFRMIQNICGDYTVSVRLQRTNLHAILTRSFASGYLLMAASRLMTSTVVALLFASLAASTPDSIRIA